MKGIVLLIALCLIATCAYAESTEGVMNNVWDRTNSALKISDSVAPSTVYAGTKTVSTTPAKLTADVTSVRYVTVKSRYGNTAPVLIGNSAVTTDVAFALSGDNAVTLNIDDVSKIYVCGLNVTDKVCWIGTK